ncbi:uncharacterized protein LOC117173633 [Belonocnema kinseyi]|uniref:uncharacterized protein LOC117173633 n=1 Tax=Belonocnema kinseyi TaxID=2817044 RepID=UPI00143D4DCB|nr:uncharacterized protein LOC117173633 [Belonocnema kinseyi]
MSRKRINPEFISALENKISRMQQYMNNLTNYDVSSDEEYSSPALQEENKQVVDNPDSDLESILGSIYGDFDLSDIGDSKLESIKGELASKDPIESDIEINQVYKDILGEDPSVPKCLDLSIHQVILPRLKFCVVQISSVLFESTANSATSRSAILIAQRSNDPAIS